MYRVADFALSNYHNLWTSLPLEDRKSALLKFADGQSTLKLKGDDFEKTLQDRHILCSAVLISRVIGCAVMGVVLFSIYWDKRKERIGAPNKELKLEFIDAAYIDPQLYSRVYRIKITNTHPTKTIRGIKANLDDVSCEAWRHLKPREIAFIKSFPLPVTPIKYESDGTSIYSCDLNPGCSKEFDLAYTRMRLGLKWYIGFPPFNPKPVYGSLAKSDYEVDHGLCFNNTLPLLFKVHVSATDVMKFHESAVLSFHFDTENKDTKATLSPMPIVRKPNKKEIKAVLVEPGPNPFAKVISSKEIKCECGETYLAQQTVASALNVSFGGHVAKCPSCGASNEVPA